MVCRDDLPTPGDDERRAIPESTLRPATLLKPAGELASFLAADEDNGSQRSKGSSKGGSQPTQDSFRMSQPTQLSPKVNLKEKKGEDSGSEDETRPVKPFAGSNISSFFKAVKPPSKGGNEGSREFNPKKRPVEPVEVSDSSDDSSASNSNSDSSDGGSESDAVKKKKAEK